MNGTEGYTEQFAKLSFHAYCWHVISRARAVAYRFAAAITSILLSCSYIYILFHASIDACTACLKRFCDSVLKAGQNGIPASGCSLARSDYPQRQHAHAHSHRFLLKPFPASALQPPPSESNLSGGIFRPSSVRNSQEKDDFILVMDIEASASRAVTRRSDGRVFLRQQHRSVRLDREQVLALEHDKDQRRFEDEVCEYSGIDDMDEEAMGRSRAKL